MLLLMMMLASPSFRLAEGLNTFRGVWSAELGRIFLADDVRSFLCYKYRLIASSLFILYEASLLGIAFKSWFGLDTEARLLSLWKAVKLDFCSSELAGLPWHIFWSFYIRLFRALRKSDVLVLPASSSLMLSFGVSGRLFRFYQVVMLFVF